MARGLALTLLAIVACSSPPPAVERPTPTREPGVLSVTAMFDLSGSRAALGNAQRNAMQLWLERHVAGSPGHIPVKVRFVDVGDSVAKLLIELHRAAVEEPVDALVVGVPVAYDYVLGNAVALAALPVVFTLPLTDDPAQRPGGGWSYALAPSLRQIAAWTLDDAAARDAIAPSLVVVRSPDRIDAYESALDGYTASRGRPTMEHAMLAADGSTPAALEARVSSLRSVHCVVVAELCSPLARAAATRSVATLFYLSYLTLPAELSDQRELAARAVWPGSRTLIGTGSSKSPRAEFVSAYAARFGQPGAQAASAYDALSLLSLSADRSAAAEPDRLRSALDTLTMPLIATSYRFTADRHGGFDPDDLAFLRWSGASIDLAPPPTSEPRLPTQPPATATP